MLDPKKAAVHDKACDSPLARVDEARASPDPFPAPIGSPQENPVPADGRRATDASQYDVLALAWIEEKLQAARRENDSLKARNQSLARDLAAASQRGTEAHHLAYHDVLTGLPNRLMLMQRLQNGISEACQRRRQLALLFIDLDRFKFVNDRLGHAIGDKVLTVVASRLLAAIRTSDIACRYGGDEFVVLLPDIPDTAAVGAIAEKVRARIEGSYGIDGNDVRIRASIGFALYPSHGDHSDALLSHADASMYQCKAARSHLHDDEATSSIASRQQRHDDGASDANRGWVRPALTASRAFGPVKA